MKLEGTLEEMQAVIDRIGQLCENARASMDAQPPIQIRETGGTTFISREDLQTIADCLDTWGSTESLQPAIHIVNGLLGRFGK